MTQTGEDDYQGQQSDIVIVSLTRSNAAHEIGFMASPERVNVLLSRARDALIMIGNAETFMASPEGGELWSRLLESLGRSGCVHHGLPVRCERHPNRIALLQKPADFDEECPDGGCNAPWSVLKACIIRRSS